MQVAKMSRGTIQGQKMFIVKNRRERMDVQMILIPREYAHIAYFVQSIK